MKRQYAGGVRGVASRLRWVVPLTVAAIADSRRLVTRVAVGRSSTTMLMVDLTTVLGGLYCTPSPRFCAATEGKGTP